MHPLANKIETLERRLTLRRRVAAGCWTAATLLAAALVLGAFDYLLRYSDRGLRMMASLAFAAAVAWAVYRWWYLPRRRRVNVLSVARQIETRYPQLRDSLASAVEFLQQSEEDATAGSAQLRRLVVAEAESAVEGLPLDEVIDRRPLRKAALWASVAMAVLLVCLVLDAGAVGTALVRLVAPLGATQWPREHYLEFRDPPTRLAVGQTFEAELIDRSGMPPDDVRIEYRVNEKGRRQTITEGMVRAGDVMIARRENVRQSFSFRAAGGDDQAMRWIDVEVIEPPRVESLVVTVHPPAYTGFPATVAARYFDVLHGSQIEVAGEASEPLTAARVLFEGGEPIAAQIGDGASTSGGKRFRVAPDQWIATTSGTYELELANASGVAGIAASWRLRVDPDLPPTVGWQQPGDDLYVLASAIVPLQLVAKDDLAIRSIDVTFERADGRRGEGAGQEAAPAAGRIELYRGPEHANTSANDVQTVDHAWSLAPLALAPGDQLTLRAEASDYRPGVGETIARRRVTIITIEELDARLAEQQTQIVRQLERALSAEQATRDEVQRVMIQQRDAGTLSSGDRNALQTAELNQRRVGWMLADAGEGVPALVDRLLAELAMNGVNSPDIERAMRQLRAALGELAGGPLGAAERELTAARKTADAIASSTDAPPETLKRPSPQIDENPQIEQQPLPIDAPAAVDALGQSLSAAGAAQDEVIAAVERLVVELSDAADYGRFVRQLSELRTDQINLERATRADIDVSTFPLEVSELTRDQRASLNQASASQNAIARRFEKIKLEMGRMAERLDLQDASASNTLKDGVLLAERLAIAANMQNATRNLAANQVGSALELERQIVDDLEQVLDLLRDRGPRGADRLEEIRRAEAELAALRERLAALREQVARNASQGNRADAERDRLGRQQEELQREIERLARQLERAAARGAGESTQRAADQLNNGPPNANANPPQPPQPGTDDELKQAEQELEDAARALAEERTRAELDLALEFINRFRGELEEMIKRQKALIAETEELDAARRPAGILLAAEAGQLESLAAEERALVQLALENRELLMGLGAVRVSLQEAERRLNIAAELLAAQESGAATQQAERFALARLEAMMEAFAQTAAEAQKKPEGGNPPPGNQNQPPQRRPAFELLEVKILRMLQVELNERTAAHQQRLAAAGPQNGAQQAEIAREAQELAAEQRRLAELVQEMLSRNNREE